jgi:hypothetical protein
MVDELLMERFRVIERIGSGGMGVVYKAFDERLQRQVAVKEIAGSDARRVLREAHAAARLNHPAIATLYELGAADGRTLLVSELAQGSTLVELARTGDLCDRDVAEIGAALCAGLAHAHARGVIHRDVKPGNVVACPDGSGGWRAKLLDFGIASISGAPALTATGEVLGTLAYMAPEQAEGERAAEQADVYSLALTLYECWAGVNPVARDTPAHTVRAIGGELPSLREYRPDLPPVLTEVLDECLLPEPLERPSVEELAATLRAEADYLDGQRPVPEPGSGEDEPARFDGVRAGRVALGLAAGLALGALAGPAGRPELAAALGVLLAPLTLAIGGVGGLAIPALAGAILPAVLGGPDALAGSAVFALSAATFGPILRLRHVALGLLAALLWSAAAAGGLRLALGSDPAAQPLVVLAAAIAAVAWDHAARRPREAAPPRPRDGVGVVPV